VWGWVGWGGVAGVWFLCVSCLLSDPPVQSLLSGLADFEGPAEFVE